MRKTRFAIFFTFLIAAVVFSSLDRALPQMAKSSAAAQEKAARVNAAGGAELVQDGADPVIRFPVMHVHGGMSPSGCYGYLYFSRGSIRYDVVGPEKFKDHSFERSRADIVKAGDPGFTRKFPNDLAFRFKNGQTETFDHVESEDVEKIQKAPLFGKYLLPRDPLMLAFTNFDQAVTAAGGTGVQVAGTINVPGAPAAYTNSSAAFSQPSSSLPAATSPAGFYADTQSDFDTLDGVIVDTRNGKLTLFGHRAATAPRSVPYLDYLAAALESNNPTFSLEWTPQSSQSIDRASAMADQDLTNRLAGTVDATRHVTKRGEWWYQMLGANVHEGMDKMSLWTAMFAVTGYPDAARVMKAVDTIERGGIAGQVSPAQMNEFFNATVHIAMPNLDFDTFAKVSIGARNINDSQDRETYFSWGLRGMAIAYRVDENRYVNRYHQVKPGHDDFWTLAKTLELSQDDIVAVQKNAFGALIGNRTFVHITPDIMREVLGITPMVVPVYQGLPANSLLARVAFDADVFGKNLMDMPEIKSSIPSYRTYFEWRQTVARAPAAEGHTWFAPDGFELIESADGRTLRFGKTPIRIHMEKYNRGASGRESVADPLLKQYADELTALYDPLSANFPVLLDLRESMKVMAIADWLKHKNIKMSLPAQGRSVWNPPAQFPGVIHMEIAVKPAPVGEVMSASGGIDFRVDKNWNLIKQRIEEQPGPPPASHTTVDYDPSSGAVAVEKPPQPPPQPAPVITPAVTPIRTPISTVPAPGRPIFDCADDAATINRLVSGMAVQDDAAKRAEAALAAAREDAQHDSAEARQAWIEATVKMLASQASSIADSSQDLMAAEGGVRSAGITAKEAARYKFLEKIKQIHDLSEKLEAAGNSYSAGKAFGDAVFVQQTARSLVDQLTEASVLFVDSGMADEAGGKLALILWGPIGEAGFSGLSTGIDLLTATSAGVISAAQADKDAQNLDVMRSQLTRNRDRIYELRQELTQDCPNAPIGQTVTPNAVDPLARPVPPPAPENPPPPQTNLPKSSATSFTLKSVESQGDFYILASSGAKLSAQEATQVPMDNGARMFTGPNSHATLTLPDGTKWTIGPDSEMQLDDFVYDPDMSLRKATVQMLEGAFRWVTGKTAGAAAQMQMNVRQTLNVGIRGTDFDLYVAPDGSGYARLYSGQLEITEVKTNFTFRLNAGQMITFAADGACSRPMPLQP